MNINAATRAELVQLEGISPRLADAIIEARPFHEMTDLTRIKGISMRLVYSLREQGVTAGPFTRRVSIDVVAAFERSKDVPGDARIAVYAFDENGNFLGENDLTESKTTLNIPEEAIDRPVTLFIGQAREDDEPAPTIPRLQAQAMLVQRRLVNREALRLDLGKLYIDPKWFIRSCCRVRGKVFKRVTLPNGTTRDLPLCNARVRICEVDRSIGRIVQALPLDLVARLRDELLDIARIAEPVANPNIAQFADRAAVIERQRAASPVARTIQQLERTPRLEAAREILIAQLDFLKPYWCLFDWLHPYYQVDCIKTVEVDEHGRFDTHIHYACYGDKPDLYFKVEQDCHEEGWLTVYEPSVHCNTYWDYCCGTEVELQVTHPRAAVGLSPTGCAFPYDSSDPASVGEWQLLSYDSQVFVVHANLLRSGKVLLFSGGAEIQLPKESRVWDPVTETFTAQTFVDDLFCAHQTALADGRILVMGGSNFNGPHGRGIKATYTFDPVAETWTKHADMAFGRWYPTAVTMPDGKVITMSGRDVGGPVVDDLEIFDPATNTWSTLAASANKDVPIYPSLHLMPDGKIFYTGARWAGNNRAWPSPPDTAVFDPTTNAWQDVATHVITNRTEATSVLLPPTSVFPIGEGHEHGEEMPEPGTLTRVLVLGGEAGAEADRASAEIIDLADSTPTWTRIADMNFRRVNPSAVILPDGHVLVVGGVRKYKFDFDPQPVLESELFNPFTQTWSVAAAMNIGRQYHSVAVLLPDGRVLATGSVRRGTNPGNEMSMEIYSPPYLFRGPRPRITHCPSSAAYGATITLTSPDVCRIKRAVLLRPGAITHHTDSEQRYVPVDLMFEGKCNIHITIPANPALLPPGYYMLFILDDCDIPSVGKFVQIG